MLTFAASFTQSGLPASGLSLADIELYLSSVNKTTGAVVVIWDGSQHPTAEIAGLGTYFRQYDADDLNAYVYFAGARYTGSETLDVDWVTGSAGVAGEAIADAMFARDIDQVESAAPKHSMASAVLKAVSKVDASTVPGKLITYRTDGVTEHMRQDVGTDEELEPVAYVGKAT